jgi:hypothetical protein
MKCVWRPSNEYQSLLASDTLSESHRRAYSRMQQRRRDRCGGSANPATAQLLSGISELATESVTTVALGQVGLRARAQVHARLRSSTLHTPHSALC